MADRITAGDHSAGAIVRPCSPFSRLEVPERRTPPAPELIERWIKPFYLVRPDRPEWSAALRPQLGELNEALVQDLLTYFNWRPRIVGAYLATIGGFLPLETQIGQLLLRSDVCYAGRGYAMALASFNTDTAIGYLTDYLDHYLEPDGRWFNQAEVMAAIVHADKVRNSHLYDVYRARWKRFAQAERGRLTTAVRRFDRELKALTALKDAAP